ncbi:hypothetical protein DYQ86_21125 [Acidobacteria bacterium AB60]|nr:hypothetical protein DYQ86_21125 [Acidobacteria bacterium AB60]
MVRIARLDADMYQFLAEPAPVVEALRASGRRIDLFTFTQTIVDTKPKYAYPMEWENLAVLPITTFENWWDKQIGFKARNKAKQAEKKGVVLREVPFGGELVGGIWQIYNETPVRQGRPYPHYGKDLDTVYREAATYLEYSTFIGAYLGDELIGFIKMVADEANVQAGLMNIISKISHRDKAPTNALLMQAVRSAASRGIRNLVYSHYAYGSRERDNLTDFKERNGFSRVDLPRYYVPLTMLGRAALGLGLHHRFVDRLPQDLGEKLREIRGKWYSRSHQSVKPSTI